MVSYPIRKVTAAPDWESLPTLEICQPLFIPDTSVRAWGQIARTGNAFLVHLKAEERHIRAEHTGPLGEICEDSCLEFFFCPLEGDRRYFNVEYNPNAARYLGLGAAGGAVDLVRLLPEEDNDEFFPQVRRFDGGWEVFYQIPFAFIRRFFPNFTAEAGRTMRANCYKCAELSAQPHFLAWSPVTERPCAFHYPELFGTMIFE